jgi:hypothetical protein
MDSQENGIICKNCYQKTSATDKFCENCGAALSPNIDFEPDKTKVKTFKQDHSTIRSISQPSSSYFLVAILYIFAFLSIISGIILASEIKNATFGFAIMFMMFIDFILFISIAKILSKLDYLIRKSA